LAYSLLTFAWCSSLLLEGSSRRRVGTRLAKLAALAWLGGGACYTSPINRVPTVSISPVGDIYHGQTATFQIDAVDPDADALTIGWAWRDGACPDYRDHATWPDVDVEGPLELRRTFPITVPDRPFCVWAFARDGHQAMTAKNQDFSPQNHPPIPVLTLASPDLATSYPLNTRFVFTGNQSTDDDGDPLTFSFSVRAAPSGFIDSPSPCADTPADTNCLEATLPGRYVVALEAQDGFLPRAPAATMTLDVLSDQPPCIAATTPPFGTLWDGDPTSDANFRVTVTDDGDQQDLRYVWYFARVGDPWTVVSTDSFPALNIKPATFLEGDEAEVRVEIHDRANKAAIDNALLMCETQPFCAVQAGSGCFQRVTWMVRWNL
jgi:hypothetical protein